MGSFVEPDSGGPSFMKPVKNLVGAQADYQMWDQVEGQVKYRVVYQVWNQVEDQVMNQVVYQMWVKVRDQVSRQVEEALS